MSLSEEQRKELGDHIRKRGTIKRKLTLFEKFVNKFQNETGDISTLQVIEIRKRCEQLNQLLSSFDEVQSDIEFLDGSEEQLSEREDFENEYYRLASEAALIVDNQQSTDGNDSDNFNSGQDLQGARASQIKLPPINLPEFNGNMTAWVSFRDTFCALVHNNRSLDNVTRLYYLKLSLKGDASLIISSIELSAANYRTAWDIILDRYENPRLIVDAHITALLSGPKLEKESAVLLRSLLDKSMSHLGALKAQGQPVDSWDSILVNIFSYKLDLTTRKAWEESRLDNTIPTWEQFKIFLKKRCIMLDAVCSHDTPKPKDWRRSVTNISTDNPQRFDKKCMLCSESHELFQCMRFNNMSVTDRFKFVKEARLCINCLNLGHRSSDCKSGGCKICGQRHNSKLHMGPVNVYQHSSSVVTNNDHNGSIEEQESTQSEEFISANVAHQKLDAWDQPVLATAVILATDCYGNLLEVRALLDSGSQSNFITSKLAKTLGHQIHQSTLKVTGISQLSCRTLGALWCVIKSRTTAYQTSLQFHILPKVTAPSPNRAITIKKLPHIKTVQYADPEFTKSRGVDLIIGAEIFFELLCVGQIRVPDTSLIFQKTLFGWIVSGSTVKGDSRQESLCLISSVLGEEHNEDTNLDVQLKRFWEQEEVKEITSWTREEQECEKLFRETTIRNSSGRYVVQLPLCDNVVSLGSSEQIAIRRFLMLERRFKLQPQLYCQYKDFIQEYCDLDHMKCSTNNEFNKNGYPSVFLPHHGVIKENSTTTKLRVVFDASCKTSTGLSLNDVQKCGPKVQDDLWNILVRFRSHRFVMSADIAKMYRQILVDDQQCQLQQIIWRDQPNQDLKRYSLKTVTYGTKSAPYLATRTLQQLSLDEGVQYPLAANAISDFYVDDLLTGTNSKTEAMELQRQVITMCAKGGMELRKWCSNHIELLSHLPTNLRGDVVEFNADDQIMKVLGVIWIPSPDVIQFKIHPLSSNAPCTKRIVVSEMSKLFDPIGLVAPVVIRAKIFIQELWRLQLKWDETLPQEHCTSWNNFRVDIQRLRKLQIPRWVMQNDAMNVQLHVFCDASENAYGACLYVRCADSKGFVKCELLTAKSRVAPVKNLTIPRLELNAAVLGSKLLAATHRALERVLKIQSSTLWTDSQIVRTWIVSSPKLNRWKTYVNNRVAIIHEISGNAQWCHLRSEDNPADIISRGRATEELARSNLWWHGPAWITDEPSEWPVIPNKLTDDETILERKNVIITLTGITSSVETRNEFVDRLISRFSRLRTLVNVTARILRLGKKRTRTTKPCPVISPEPLTSEECDLALKRLILLTQQNVYKFECNSLTTHNRIIGKSSLVQLHPFLDATNLLRVGGRLQHSNQPYDSKHPLILPGNTNLSKLIIDDTHRRLLHAGPTQLIATLRQRFWIIGVKRAASQIVWRCLKCYRWKANRSKQLMGSLPKSRVTVASPFLTCGVDYAGPFTTRIGPPRSKKTTKSYIALFICFVSKAIHIELVSDLTTEAFISAVKRFVSRRGCPSEINSDNGRNFVGTANALKTFLNDNGIQEAILEYASDQRVTWKFIPPHAPHMGGLWEAGIKSAKHHLKRVVGETIMSFEELSTILCQIEAVLNSRPLAPMHDDVESLDVLTPAHFLIRKPLTAFPDHTAINVKCYRTRWHMLTQMTHNIWNRWQLEYLNTLQRRTKWQVDQVNLLPGALVIIIEDHQPPLTWKMGRILQTHPGSDGHTRAVTLKTSNGEMLRPIHKLAPINHITSGCSVAISGQRGPVC